MEAPPRIRGSEDIFGNETLVGGSAGEVASESSNGKRKVESAYGLFCVMRKKSCRHKCVDDDMFPDFDYAQNCESDLRFEIPNYLVDEDVIVGTDDIGEFTGSKSISSHISIFHSGWSKIPCTSDIFKNDGPVVNMPLSLQKTSSNDELRLQNICGEPIPISIVLPDGGGSSLPLPACSLVSCGNEYNVHDEKNGLEISPIPLTKTPGGTTRPWSACGSLAAVKNLPLMEDSSGACNSLDEILQVNVSSSEEKDAESAQTLSVLYQEDVDGENEICFSDVDAMIRKLNLLPDDSDSCLNTQEWNMSKHPRHTLLGSEHCTTTSIRRAVMSQGAIAVLHRRDSKHLIRTHEVILGRSSHGLNVDIDLGKDGYGSKISRRQALVKLENNGSFSLKNLGKRPILVNGEKLDTEEIVTLTSSSSIDIRGIVFAFKSNKEAVRQFLNRSKRRNREEDDTKFRWCE